MSEKMYKIREVAEIFGVIHITVLNWIKKGKLQRVVLPSGHFRVRESEVRRLLSEKAAEETTK